MLYTKTHPIEVVRAFYRSHKFRDSYILAKQKLIEKQKNEYLQLRLRQGTIYQQHVCILNKFISKNTNNISYLKILDNLRNYHQQEQYNMINKHNDDIKQHLYECIDYHFYDKKIGNDPFSD